MLALLLLVAGDRSGAGHQVAHYPSYYPDEIRISAVSPPEAAVGLSARTLHAYVGATPQFAGPVPAHVKPVTSLASFLVLAFDSASARFASAEARCSAGRSVLAALSREKAAGFVFHPYPVTPYHADYLHHLDRIEAAKNALAERSASPGPLKIAAKGPLAEAIVRNVWGEADVSGDLMLEVVPIDAPLISAGALGGWSAAPWIKQGWFQAHWLLAPALDPARRSAADDDHGRLTHGDVSGLAEHADLERRLVASLTQGCERMVVGYAVRQEFLTDAYPEGIENVGYDSLSGMSSPLFVRTVKLKDYPWNGKLHLGVRERADAAWNPVSGFSDAMGRLIWAAVGDPAMIAFPDNASWMPNRVQSNVTRVSGQSGGIRVPAEAVRPQPGTGALQPAGENAFASTKVVYEMLASPFADGTEMTMADLVYPYAFALRWGAADAAGRVAEPNLAPLSAALQERLAGLRPLRIDKTTHAIAEGMDIVLSTPVVEVYLRHAAGDEGQVAALAPPWTTVPWHLLMLMEEAVSRGYAAFSQAEAARRQVPWLDLVRDRALIDKLLELVVQFEREHRRPEALKDLVSADEAQARWRSLRTFAKQHGNFLVTNGPYRLKTSGLDSVVLEAVREFSYPLGFGTFDRFVDPPHAVIEAATQQGDEITVRVSAEMNLKAGRGTRLVREPLTRTTTRDVHELLVASRYLLIDPKGGVLNLDKMQWKEDGQFAIKLPERLAPGDYSLLLGIFLDGNTLQTPVRLLRVRVGAGGRPG